MRRALAAIALALLTLAASPKSPAGSHDTLEHVLAAYRHAQGAWAPGTPETRIMRWSVTDGDLTGTEAEIESGNDDRIDTTLGIVTESEGTFGGRDWSLNANGELVAQSGIHERMAVDDRVLRAAIGSGAHEGVRLTGRITQPFDGYIVTVDPPGGVPEELYVDAKTSLLDERIVRYPGRTETFTYDDYRTTLGLTFAWHVHESIDNDREVVDLRLQDAQIGSPVDPSRIAVPEGRSVVTFTQPESALPASIVGDRIIIPVQFGTHTVNLQLDSGSSGIAVDSAIISALDYTQSGHITEKTAGEYVESEALVPSMTIGDLSMRNVYVSSLPFESVAGDKPVAGLLGFDFIDSVVLRIDYANDTVQAFDPQSFVPPPRAVALPIALDDQIPAIVARIGSTSGVRLIVDTGADRSILFSSFGTEHPGALVDQGLGTEMEEASPFLGTFEGVGGTVPYRPVELGPLTVGAWTFPKWLFDITQDPTKFEIEDYSGLLGQDLLRYYDLYLDYPHGRILLVPNARYTERFGS